MSAHGIATVARLELLGRRRTSRWPVVLGVWFLVIGAVTTLAWLAMRSSMAGRDAGSALYDIVTFLVLGLGMLVVPALTATSINGDREQGVLASLQTTLLTPADLVLGKLLASWAVALVFLATTLPFLAWAWIAGGTGVGEILGSLAVLVLVLGVVCAVGLMFSTLTARPVTSAVLTYLTVALLVVGTLVVFVLSFFLVSEKEQVRYFGLPDTAAITEQGPGVDDCRHLTREQDVIHTERIWWLLAPNPFVVVADAVPPGRGDPDGPAATGFRPMQAISYGVRSARAGETGAERQECWVGSTVAPEEPEPEGVVWPYGLATLLLLGAGATAVAIRRVRTPIGRLPNGTRIA